MITLQHSCNDKQGSINLGASLFSKGGRTKIFKNAILKSEKCSLPDFEKVSRKWVQQDSLGFSTSTKQKSFHHQPPKYNMLQKSDFVCRQIPTQ